MFLVVSWWSGAQEFKPHQARLHPSYILNVELIFLAEYSVFGLHYMTVKY